MSKTPKKKNHCDICGECTGDVGIVRVYKGTEVVYKADKGKVICGVCSRKYYD